MSEYVRGWEIMYSLYKAEVKTKSDLMLLAVHFGLMKHGFLCLPFTTVDVAYDFPNHGLGKETLPPGWNAEGAVLNYLFMSLHFKLACGSGTTTVYNLVVETGNKHQVTATVINVDASIKTVDGQPSIDMDKLEEVLKKIEQDLVKPFSSSNEIHTQTEPEKLKKKQDQSSTPRYPETVSSPQLLNMQPMPLNIGSSDLYPFGTSMPGPFLPRGGPTAGGGLGGGMIFDPFSRPTVRPPGFGRGSRGSFGYVPGARFDPIGVQPPNPLGPFAPRQPGQFGQPGAGGPDPDHLPPPGYEDMFM